MKNLVGHVIGERYRVHEFIGRGGMAEVYKVWDQTRMVYLAMKLLHEDLALDKLFLRRFQREAQNLSKLQHPNIVRFYGLEKAQYQAFILMDYVEGVTLKHKIYDLDKTGMALGDVLRVTRALCGALGFAHSEGIIHCDLKPGNVMIKPDGQVLLADFGIARMTDSATATMVGMGTPAYMAPEQVKGLDPVPQTDIYALGVILYEMLTGGERPFTGESAATTGTTSAKVRWEQVNLEPPSPRRYNPNISSELEAVVLKCLVKEPADRYQTALHLMVDVESAIGDRQTIKTELQAKKSAAEPAGVIKPAPQKETPVRSSKNLRPVKWWKHWWVWAGFAGTATVILFAINSVGLSSVPSSAGPRNTTAVIAKKTNTPNPTQSIIKTNTSQPTQKTNTTDLEGKRITIAVENAFLPFNYIDPVSGEPAGWDYDVWAAICEEINCTPVFVETAWEGMIQAVADGQFDTAGDGITITEARAAVVDFSIGYLGIDQRLLVRKNETRFHRIEDIVADVTLKLGAQAGTTNYSAAVAYLPQERVYAFEQFPYAVMALVVSDIDAVIIDEVAGQGYLGDYAEQLKLVGPPIFTDQLGFIFPKGSDLVEPVDFALTKLKQSGFLDEANALYFGPDFNVTYDDLFQD